MYSKATPQEQTQDPKYPCLMIGTDGEDIVLFHEDKEGIVVGLPSWYFRIVGWKALVGSTIGLAIMYMILY